MTLVSDQDVETVSLDDVKDVGLASNWGNALLLGDIDVDLTEDTSRKIDHFRFRLMDLSVGFTPRAHLCADR